MRINFIIFLAIFCLNFAAYGSEQPGSADLLSAGLNALGNTRPQAAYKQFIQVHQIISPHPDKDIESFIQRANSGESDSFALIAFYIWSGYAGFREDKPAGKLALNRAMTDGSSQAPYWIAQTFFQANEGNDQEKADNFITGIQWLGVSAGMGATLAHDKAMEIIDETAKSDQKLKTTLMGIYNSGLEESKNYKRDTISPKNSDRKSSSTKRGSQSAR